MCTYVCFLKLSKGIIARKQNAMSFNHYGTYKNLTHCTVKTMIIICNFVTDKQENFWPMLYSNIAIQRKRL